jgi:D-aminopeptidase
VGVLVQTNFGGELVIDGVPVGQLLAGGDATSDPDGSCMIVIATDTPLDTRQLRRLARRSFVGMARTGASFSHGSGDYAIAFSTAEAVRIADARPHAQTVPRVSDDALSPLFEAVADATQSAIVHSLVHATTVRGRDGHEAKALEVERVRELLQQRR